MATLATESPIVGNDSKDCELNPQVVTAMDDAYPIERVEAVYRKLDLRIIPGRTSPLSSLVILTPEIYAIK